MRISVLVSTIVISAGLAIAQTPQPKALSPFDQELVSNQNQFMQAIAEKNTVFVNQSVADNFRGVSTNGDFFDREEIVESAHDGAAKDHRIYDVTVVRLADDCAVVSYNLIVPGSRIRYRHVSDTWSKEGSRWKLKFEQSTINLWSATDFD